MFERDACLSDLRISVQRLPNHRRQASPFARTAAMSWVPAIQASAKPSIPHASSAANVGLWTMREPIRRKTSHRGKTAIPLPTAVLS